LTPTNKWLRGDWMQTYSGGRFYPSDPKAEEIHLLDIAHSLSLLCRYGGHIDRFYSVGEHCVLMSQAVSPTNALAALLHDATEAYVVDVPRPLKLILPDYRAIEDAVWLAISDRFNVNPILPAEVHEADSRILLTERKELMPRAEAWFVDSRFQPLPVTITGWSPRKAERMYIDRFNQLWGTE
jgi:uncharacterized protein